MHFLHELAAMSRAVDTATPIFVLAGLLTWFALVDCVVDFLRWGEIEPDRPRARRPPSSRSGQN